MGGGWAKWKESGKWSMWERDQKPSLLNDIGEISFTCVLFLHFLTSWVSEWSRIILGSFQEKLRTISWLYFRVRGFNRTGHSWLWKVISLYTGVLISALRKMYGLACLAWTCTRGTEKAIRQRFHDIPYIFSLSLITTHGWFLATLKLDILSWTESRFPWNWSHNRIDFPSFPVKK